MSRDTETTVPAYHIANIQGALSTIREEIKKIDREVSNLGTENLKPSIEDINALISYPSKIGESIDVIRKSIFSVEEHTDGLIKLKMDEMT